jgi:hypothetical protein
VHRPAPVAPLLLGPLALLPGAPAPAAPLLCTADAAEQPAYRLVPDDRGDSMGNAMQRSEYVLFEAGSRRALLRCRIGHEAGRLDCDARVAGGIDARFTHERESGRYRLRRADGRVETGRCRAGR